MDPWYIENELHFREVYEPADVERCCEMIRAGHANIKIYSTPNVCFILIAILIFFSNFLNSVNHFKRIYFILSSLQLRKEMLKGFKSTVSFFSPIISFISIWRMFCRSANHERNFSIAIWNFSWGFGFGFERKE